MSGLEILGAVAASLQIVVFLANSGEYIKRHIDAGNEYDDRLTAVYKKFGRFGKILEAFGETARKIARIIEDGIEAGNTSFIKEEIKGCQDTLEEMIKCYKFYEQPNTTQALKLAVRYWRYEHDGKVIIDKGLKDIEERIQGMSFILQNKMYTLLFEVHQNTVPKRPGTGRRIDSAIDGPDFPDNLETCNDNRCVPEDEGIGSEPPPAYSEKPPEWNLGLLKNQDFNFNAKELSVNMIEAIKNKSRSEVAKFLKTGHDPLALTKEGQCAIHYAARAESKQIIRALLDSESLRKHPNGINTPDIYGTTPLHVASENGYTSMAKELLDKGALVNLNDNQGRSALYKAVDGHHYDTATFLVNRGARFADADRKPKRFPEWQNAIKFGKR